MNRLFGSLLFALLIVLSGCSTLSEPTETPTHSGTATPAPSPTTTPVSSTPASPAPTPGPDLRTVEVTFKGTYNASHTGVFWFVDDPVSQVVVQYRNGTERTVTIENNALPNGTLVDAVFLSPAVAAEREINHTDDSPRNGVTLYIPTATSDLFLVILTEEHVVGWRYYTCGPSDVGGVSVNVTEQGVQTENLACDL